MNANEGSKVEYESLRNVISLLMLILLWLFYIFRHHKSKEKSINTIIV